MNTPKDDNKQSEDSNLSSSKHTVGSVIDKILEEHSVKLIAVVGLIILCFFMSWFFNNSEYSKINPPKIFSQPAVQLPVPSKVSSKQADPSSKKIRTQWEPSATQTLDTLTQQLKQAKKDIAKTFPDTAPVKQSIIKKKVGVVKNLKKPSKQLASPPTLKLIVKKHPRQSMKHSAMKKAYVLQIMSSNSPKGLQRLIQAQHLQQQARIITTQYKGKTWYILGYGHFQTHHQAKHVLHALPAAIKKMHPWVRPIY